MTQPTTETTGGPATAIEPVRATVTVAAPKERAFEVFVTRMTSWWPPTHKIGGADLAEAVVERRPGGRWYERDTDGSECEWGRVLAYEPPERLVLTWQIDERWAFNPELVTEVEVRFIEEGADRTRVEVEHRNLERFGEAAEQMRAIFDSDGGWPLILRNFAEQAAAT